MRESKAWEVEVRWVDENPERHNQYECVVVVTDKPEDAVRVARGAFLHAESFSARPLSRKLFVDGTVILPSVAQALSS